MIDDEAMTNPDAKCAYCGDLAVFGRLDGSGPVSCSSCVGMLVKNIVPNSAEFHALRPHTCPFCGKRTSGLASCGRVACLERSQATGGTN